MPRRPLRDRHLHRRRCPRQSGPAGTAYESSSRTAPVVEEFGESIGVATNNVAEYRGLLAALEWAKSHGHTHVHVRSDSLLLVQQMLGNYKVKNPGLMPLHARARLLAHDIGRVTFEHVRRESQHARRSPGERRYGRGRERLIAPASRPAGGPSRRKEQKKSGWLAVHSPAEKMLPAGTPVSISISRIAPHPSKNQ